MVKRRGSNLYIGQIYDSIYGFIRLTKTEEQLINSPYFQRLRWIKQLGFANYIFAGAEHSRFSHVIGVMHSADQMLRAIGKDVSDEKLFDVSAVDPQTLFHKSIRIAAMLHDIGTFPFSHSIEGSYIKYGQELEKKGKLPGKPLPNNHEHLGSYLIKKTDFPMGITRILKESGLDAGYISKLIKGDSNSLVGNQLLHSDIDADRLDYLIRDAHYTGIKYGHIDRDYILYHLTTFRAGSGHGQEVLGVKENALHAVEDFLLARFAWYSQVVRNSGSAKFDVLAAHLALYLLQNNLIFQYSELLSLALKDPERFYGFNDVYFMTRVQDLYWSKKIKDPILNEQMRMLIYRIPPRTVRLKETEHKILEVSKNGSIEQKNTAVQKLKNKLHEIEALFKRHGTGREWIIADIPSKDVIFTKCIQMLTKTPNSESVYVIDKSGNGKLLIERENSLISKLSHYVNFLPNVYCNDEAHRLLTEKKIITN